MLGGTMIPGASLVEPHPGLPLMVMIPTMRSMTIVLGVAPPMISLVFDKYSLVPIEEAL